MTKRHHCKYKQFRQTYVDLWNNGKKHVKIFRRIFLLKLMSHLISLKKRGYWNVFVKGKAYRALFSKKSTKIINRSVLPIIELLLYHLPKRYLSYNQRSRLFKLIKRKNQQLFQQKSQMFLDLILIIDNIRKKPLWRQTTFEKSFRLKHKLQRYYNSFSLRQFRVMIRKHRLHLSGLTKNKQYHRPNSQRLISHFYPILESRLSSIIYRSGFSKSVYTTRQLINHGFVSVNNKVITYPSFKIRHGDIVRINAVKQQRYDYVSNLMLLFRYYSGISTKILKEKAVSLLHNDTLLSLKNNNFAIGYRERWNSSFLTKEDFLLFCKKRDLFLILKKLKYYPLFVHLSTNSIFRNMSQIDIFTEFKLFSTLSKRNLLHILPLADLQLILGKMVLHKLGYSLLFLREFQRLIPQSYIFSQMNGVCSNLSKITYNLIKMLLSIPFKQRSRFYGKKKQVFSVTSLSNRASNAISNTLSVRKVIKKISKYLLKKKYLVRQSRLKRKNTKYAFNPNPFYPQRKFHKNEFINKDKRIIFKKFVKFKKKIIRPAPGVLRGQWQARSFFGKHILYYKMAEVLRRALRSCFLFNHSSSLRSKLPKIRMLDAFEIYSSSLRYLNMQRVVPSHLKVFHKDLSVIYLNPVLTTNSVTYEYPFSMSQANLTTIVGFLKK